MCIFFRDSTGCSKEKITRSVKLNTNKIVELIGKKYIGKKPNENVKKKSKIEIK